MQTFTFENSAFKVEIRAKSRQAAWNELAVKVPHNWQSYSLLAKGNEPLLTPRDFVYVYEPGIGQTYQNGPYLITVPRASYMLGTKYLCAYRGQTFTDAEDFLGAVEECSQFEEQRRAREGAPVVEPTLYTIEAVNGQDETVQAVYGVVPSRVLRALRKVRKATSSDNWLLVIDEAKRTTVHTFRPGAELKV